MSNYTSLNYSDIILTHQKSIVDSRSKCDITQKLGDKIYNSPVCCSNMKSILNSDICKIFDDKKWFYVYHRIDGPLDVSSFVKKANEENWYSISISVGIGPEWMTLVEYLKNSNYRVDSFTVDVALSYNDNILSIVECIKKYFPNAYLIVGNGSTPQWIKWLEDIGGIHCAKLGIGVSKSCRTRQFTGFGSTTVTSLLECVEVASKIDIMSDGGLTVDNMGEVWIGDINKAIVLGAHFVMSGAVFSKCLDSPAILNGYYGNASAHAKGHSKHVEGAKIQVETNGLTISQMCSRIEDSIRSGISYSGGTKLSDMINVKWNIIK